MSLKTGILLVAVLGALVPALALALPQQATMQFGRPNLGSGCLFPCVDDQSFHAVDRVSPGAVAISAGGTVNFNVQGFHQVAIYSSGVAPKDIDVNGPFPFVNDPTSLLFLGAPGANASYTFANPGKYLVICNVAPHFEEAQQWGWVQVQ